MANSKKIDLSKLTMKDINDLTAEFYSSKLIYTTNIQQLGKHFLTKVLPLNVWSESFENIRNTFVKSSKLSEHEVPVNENDFYMYILKTYFQLKQEPRQKLLDTYMTATQHLKEIDDRILRINEEIEAIKASKNQKDFQEKTPVLTFYLNLNKRARSELLEFLKQGIYEYVITECTEDQGIGLWNTLQYEYAFWGSKNYEVSYPTMISNKFSDLPYDSKLEMERLFINDKSAFQDALKDYIIENDTIENIRLTYTGNHIINKKAYIIDQCLLAYERGNKTLFGGLSIFIIEGIIHEICSLFDITQNELLAKGLQQKIDFLQDKLSYDLHYEYYSFVFRILRNKMAHGIAESDELEEMADLLLLDIMDVIEAATSNHIPLNQKRFFVSQALKETSLNKYNYIFGYLFLYKVEIPIFYNLSNNISELHKIIQCDDFWVFLDNYISSNDTLDKSLAHNILKILKESGIEGVKQKCVKKFKTYSAKDLPEFDQHRFINSLIGHNRYII